MKKHILILLFLISSVFGFSQTQFSENGQTYTLKTEVDGTLDLFWTVIDENYRYFISKGDSLKELKNTKDSDNNYQEEYKSLLNTITGSNTDNLKLTLGSLRDFIIIYNKESDPNYESSFKRAKLKTRVALFGGVTNIPFVDNPDNENLNQFFGELEVYDTSTLKNHSFFFRAKHIADSDELNYSTTQLGLGYRYKFINTKTVRLYANVTFATLNFSSASISFLNESNQVTTREESATNFDAPFIFGIGMDVKLTENMFVSLDYDELCAVFLDNQGNFSRHIALGIKFNL